MVKKFNKRFCLVPLHNPLPSRSREMHRCMKVAGIALYYETCAGAEANVALAKLCGCGDWEVAVPVAL